jgi:GcrA cell cycle regulator
MPRCEPPTAETEWSGIRVTMLTRLWEEGVSTSEMARLISEKTQGRFTKNAIIGKVHRIGLEPRIVLEKPGRKRDPFDFTGPACMWPHGHPDEDDFHFCGGQPIRGKPYCSRHAAIAYPRPKEEERIAA